MIKKIKEFFAAEKYEEKPVELDIRPEYKDNLELCGVCGCIFKHNDGERIRPFDAWAGTEKDLTEDELYSIELRRRDKVCGMCKTESVQRNIKLKADEELKKKACEKLAKVLGLEIETVLYFVNKIK